MPFYAFISDATDSRSGNANCGHIDLLVHVATCDQYGSQGQVQSGQPLRFQATGLGDAVPVGDYLLALSGSDVGRYRKVVSRVNANTVTVNNQWATLAEVTPIDFAICTRVKQFGVTLDDNGDALWDTIEVDTMVDTYQVLLQALAQSISDTPSGTKAQRVAKLNDAAIILRIL